MKKVPLFEDSYHPEKEKFDQEALAKKSFDEWHDASTDTDSYSLKFTFTRHDLKVESVVKHPVTGEIGVDAPSDKAEIADYKNTWREEGEKFLEVLKNNGLGEYYDTVEPYWWGFIIK